MNSIKPLNRIGICKKSPGFRDADAAIIGETPG